MRVTNRMMTTNMLNNINRNKKNMTVAGNQYSTGHKIQKPSEDPVVAVRSLKYRTQLTELEQFYEKNIPDAKSWMDVTESALDSVNDILTKMNTYCNQGASDTLEVTDRDSIAKTLEQYKEQVYQYANTDYAGRYVFTGYRTDTPIIFKEDTKKTYTITEKLDAKSLDNVSYIDKSSGTASLNKAFRMRFAYDNLDSTAGSFKELSYTRAGTGDSTITTVINSSGTTVTTRDKDGNITGTTTAPVTAVQKSVSDTTPSPYSVTNTVNYIPETGELILPENIYKEMTDATSISVRYNKTEFQEGDVKPEMYFECESEGIKYDAPSNQNIQYEINFSQSLTVNTLGCKAISTNIGREIDEMVNTVREVQKLETEITKKAGILTDADKEALNAELTLRKRVMQEKFSAGITMSQEEQNTINVALADHGSRYVRLELTESRLSDQKVDFSEMLETNDSVDMEDAVINYNAAQVTYNASLSATAKVVKNTLLDFL